MNLYEELNKLKKKQTEYKLLFNYDDLTEASTKKEVLKCEKCGKDSVSLHKGVCFACREKEVFDSNKKITSKSEIATQQNHKKLDIKSFLILVSMFVSFAILLVVGLLWMGGIFKGPVFEKSFICIATGFFSAYLYVFILHEALAEPLFSLMIVGIIILFVVNIIFCLLELISLIAFEFIIGFIVLALCKKNK